MSSILVYVLVPRNIRDGVEEIDAEEVHRLLDPYSYELEVPEYARRCHCVYERAARKAVEEGYRGKTAEASTRTGGGISSDDLSARKLIEIPSLKDKRPPGTPKPAFATFIKDPQGIYKEIMAEMVESVSPDENCEECSGSGFVKSTTNPFGKFEDWKIGGLTGEKVLEEAIVSANVIRAQTDVIPVNELDWEVLPVPDAVVTPDGSWHADEEPVWDWKASLIEMDWEGRFREILEEYSDHNLIAVYCR
jgi:hypothetical protein